MDQRNLILAIAFSIAILLGFQFLFPPAPPPTDKGVPEETSSTAGAPPAPGGEGVAGAPQSAGQQVPAITDRETALATSQRIRLESPRLHGSVALAGGRIDDLTLIDYHATPDSESPEIVLLTPPRAENSYYAEFGWVPADPDIPVPGADAVWETDSDVLGPDQPATLTWNNGQGLEFTRVMELDENYMFTVRQSVRNTTDQPVTLHPYGFVARAGQPDTSGFYILHEGPLGVFDGTLRELDYDDLEDADNGAITQEGRADWLGITDKYWLTALIPEGEPAVRARFSHMMRGGADRWQVDYLGEPVSLAPGAEEEVTNRFFAGAKEVDLLDYYQDELGIEMFDRAVDFGWFYFLTKPIFQALQWLAGILGNFGLAILALTVVIKLVFFPLANKSYRAMSKMKNLQPLMMELRERFGDDKARLNQEMMALYKREKVNPAAGCLPILIQIPVFFALYKVLFVTIEMRHAPFFGWINDLSARDPTNLFTLFGLIPWHTPDILHIGIWPLIMGFTMFAQQRLNPQPADPMQARIFMLMPIVFTVMLARFPAGLVIYWAWNNTLSVAQQWLIMHRAGDRPAQKKAQGATTPASPEDKAAIAVSESANEGSGEEKKLTRSQRKKRNKRGSS